MMTMPVPVDLLVDDVSAGRFLDALDRFYADDASTREPDGPPTVGKAALLRKERAFLASVAQWHRCEALHVLATDMYAAIHWEFELTRTSGERVVVEEVAIQEWRDVDGSPKIVTEQYFPLPPRQP